MCCAVVLFYTWGCHGNASTTEARSEPAAARATEEPATTGPREALPRTVAGVALGMSVAQAEAELGHLSCHESKAGYAVCSGERADTADVRHLEVYVAHDVVISVSYETPALSQAGQALNGLIARYGKPSLSGMRQRDQTGRLHEIYGWKDAQSMYSLRFVWRDSESESADIVATAVALWDRKGYQQWEAEAHPPPAATEAARPREEI